MTIDYQRRILEALRGVVRDLLAETAEEGLPGAHHFYLSFRTDAPGVEVPAALRDAHPEEATIVLQHQFWNLEVDEERFAVTLAFSGVRQRLVVPFAALTGFVDPAEPFGLRFDEEGAPAGTEPAGDEAAEGEEDEDAVVEGARGTGRVVEFRPGGRRRDEDG